jgi:plastocyanin
MMLAGGCTRNAGQVAVEETPVPTLSPTPSASPSPTEPPLPVALEGPVNNKGTSDLVGMGTAATQEITMADFAFAPTFVKVAPEATLKVTLKNPGGLADHTFTLDALGVDRQLKPGEQADFEMKLPAAGESLRFYCRLHADKGMQGAIYFNDGEPVSIATVAPSPAAQAARSSTTTRRVNPAPPPAPAPAPRSTGDLDVPDLDEDEAGNLRGSDGNDGARGEEGVPGEPGANPPDADFDNNPEEEEDEDN